MSFAFPSCLKEVIKMRNLKRIEVEIRILERLFGIHNVSYADDGSWIKISNYKLPRTECEYSLDSITLQIIIPKEYDNIAISEVYVDSDLMIRKKNRFVVPPHIGNEQDAIGKGYLWLCFHPAEEFIGLLDFINILKTYFTNPFKYQKL